MQNPLLPHFNGQVIALINGGSFSTTCELLATLHHHKRAIFIGEETAGGYYRNTSGDSINIVLPNSKLELAVQLIGYYLAIDGNKHGSRGIQPDHHIAETIDDILTGKDRAMELAESLAKK